MAPTRLLASKVISFAMRRGSPKSGTDWRDLALLILAFPELKSEEGSVRDQLEADGVDATILATWRELVAQDITPEEED